MKSRILFFSILGFFLAVNSVYAAFTVSVDISKSLTENEQTAVAVTVANPSGGSTESNIVTSLSSSTSWFSVVAACSTIISLSAGQSGTSTCIIKPTSIGSDLTLTATSTSQGSTTGSGSASGINVASQSSSLTASVSADSSVATSTTFYVGVTVTAPSANDVVNARVTISESGACTVDTSQVPVQQSLGNITKGTSKSPANWKLTSSSSSGTCTITVNVVSDVGGTASPSKSITVGTGGGVGGGITGYSVLLTITGKSVLPKVAVEKGKVTITGLIVAAGKSTTVNIDKTEDVAFRKLVIYAKNAIDEVQVNVTKLAGKPANITQEVTGKVYHYIQVDKNVSDANINQTTIRFEVEKSWLDANNIDESTVALYRYSDKNWNKLQTTKLSADSDSILYESISPGLSVFAIGGEVKAAAEVPVAPPAEEKKEILPAAITKGRGLLITILVIAIAAIGTVFYLVKKMYAKKQTGRRSRRIKKISFNIPPTKY